LLTNNSGICKAKQKHGSITDIRTIDYALTGMPLLHQSNFKMAQYCSAIVNHQVLQILSINGEVSSTWH